MPVNSQDLAQSAQRLLRAAGSCLTSPRWFPAGSAALPAGMSDFASVVTIQWLTHACLLSACVGSLSLVLQTLASLRCPSALLQTSTGIVLACFLLAKYCNYVFKEEITR